MLLQNLAFFPLLLKNTSGFIYPLNWLAQLVVLSSVLPVLARICLFWLTATQSWWPAHGLPLYCQTNPVLSALYNSFKHYTIREMNHKWIEKKWSLSCFPYGKKQEFPRFLTVWKRQVTLLQPASFLTCLLFWCSLLLISVHWPAGHWYVAPRKRACLFWQEVTVAKWLSECSVCYWSRNLALYGV